MVQYSADQLVRLAKRENNRIRPYLFVNPLQGKHIPADPQDTVEMCRAIAEKINASYPDELLYVIGFAETATGIAACVTSFLKNAVLYQNTTRESGKEACIAFSEIHSHATGQLLRSAGMERGLQTINRIIFIDDEVTTGNTICNLIAMIKETYKPNGIRYTIASVLNSMSEERYRELQQGGIDCIFLNRIPFEYKKDSIQDVRFNPEKHILALGKDEPMDSNTAFVCPVNPRNLVSCRDYMKAVREFAEEIRRSQLDDGQRWNKVLVLGTEEFMYPTIVVGEMIRQQGCAQEVWIHSTTRSPIVAFARAGYPLWCRYQIRSPYDAQRTTYIYNLQPYEKVFVLTDAAEPSMGLNDLCRALKLAGSNHIAVIRWQYSKESEKV